MRAATPIKRPDLIKGLLERSLSEVRDAYYDKALLMDASLCELKSFGITGDHGAWQSGVETLDCGSSYHYTLMLVHANKPGGFSFARKESVHREDN